MRYDPFAPGPYPVEQVTVAAVDGGRTIPVDVWRPAAAEAPGPLVVYSHGSGLHGRIATFLAEHLASHGYVVGAPEHWAGPVDEMVARRIPDLRLVLDRLTVDHPGGGPVGLVGHSFGGWTVLATPDVEPRVGAVVAHGPGGGGPRRPGVIPLQLDLAWGRDVPTLYLAAEQDVPIPLADVLALYDRTPATRRIFALRRADHQHFLDDVATRHEETRAMVFPEEATWITDAMRPIGELCTEAEAHTFVRGLTLAHLDATLRGDPTARHYLDGDVVADLAARGVQAMDERRVRGSAPDHRGG